MSDTSSLDLSAQLATAIERVDAARVALAAAKAEHDAAVLEADRLQDQIDASRPTNQAQLEIQAYLAAQHAARAKRAEEAAKLREAGVPLNPAPVLSPLEEAAAKKPRPRPQTAKSK